MRHIALRKATSFSTIEVLKEVLLRPGPQGVSVDEMRERLRLLELVRAAEGMPVLELDNADYQLILTMLEGFRFGMVTKELVDIVDGILESSPPSRPRLAS